MSRLVRGLSIASGLLLLGGATYAYRARIDTVEHDQFSRDVRTLSALDARLNAEVMQSRLSLVLHYDDLVGTATALDGTHRRLETLPAFVGPGEREELSRLRAATRAATDAKQESIEAFKSDNAVLRSSVRFFTVAAEDLGGVLARHGDAVELERKLSSLLLSVLRFNQTTGSAEAAERADAAIAELEHADVPEVLRRELAVVLQHARAVRARGAQVGALTDAILAVPTVERMAQLDLAYGRAFQRAVHGGERRRGGLFGLALITLLLLAIDVNLRLRRSRTAERRAKEILADANHVLHHEKERERELGELKSRFVSMTSHEFRTPLSVILSSTELLEAYGERWSPAKKSDHFARIKLAIGAMIELLDSVLFISKGEMGKVECKRAPLDLSRFCRQLTESFEATLTPKHTFSTTIEGDFDGCLADEKLLTHILTNLLSNAAKYSPDGGMVAFELARDGDAAVFTVTDRGIGIPDADRAELFESFHRGSNVGHIPGTGLGLPVVKRSVDAHLGHLEVASKTGEGTRIRVAIPVFAASRAKDAAA